MAAPANAPKKKARIVLTPRTFAGRAAGIKPAGSAEPARLAFRRRASYEAERMAAVSTQLVREAFRNAGERRYLLSKLFYTAIFGRRWDVAMVGWAYIKCLDDAVDEEPAADKALAVVATQRDLLARVYDGGPVDAALAVPESYGRAFFAYDAQHGTRWRPLIETILDTMEFDVTRRHTLISAEQLDGYMVELGAAIIRYTANFLADDFPLTDPFIRSASRAYLYADSLIDLEHDLRFGVINIPAEDVAAWQLDVAAPDPKRRQWVAERAPAVLGYFGEAIAAAAHLPGIRVKLLSRLFLSRKRAQLERFLARNGG